jgi:hypothetical protein
MKSFIHELKHYQKILEEGFPCPGCLCIPICLNKYLSNTMIDCSILRDWIQDPKKDLVFQRRNYLSKIFKRI